MPCNSNCEISFCLASIKNEIKNEIKTSFFIKHQLKNIPISPKLNNPQDDLPHSLFTLKSLKPKTLKIQKSHC